MIGFGNVAIDCYMDVIISQVNRVQSINCGIYGGKDKVTNSTLFEYQHRFPGIMIPVIKITNKDLWDHLIITMRNPLLVRWLFHIKTAPYSTPFGHYQHVNAIGRIGKLSIIIESYIFQRVSLIGTLWNINSYPFVKQTQKPYIADNNVLKHTKNKWI